MSQFNYSTHADQKTKQMVVNATAKSAEHITPENVVVENPPPEPDYPRYRVQPGQPISLADFDPNAPQDYQVAFEDMLNHCSTTFAPWYVAPANHKQYRNLVVARTITDTLEAMNPQYPSAESGLEKIVVPD